MCMNLKNSHPFTESAEGITGTSTMASLGAGPPPHAARLLDRPLSKGLMSWGVVPTSAVRILVD